LQGKSFHRERGVKNMTSQEEIIITDLYEIQRQLERRQAIIEIATQVAKSQDEKTQSRKDAKESYPQF